MGTPRLLLLDTGLLEFPQPPPAELPDGPKPRLEKETLNERGEKKQPADSDLLVALDEDRPW